MSHESLSTDINSSKFFYSQLEPNKKLLTLSDISPLNQSWDKHRANADIVAEHYAFGEKGYSSRYAQRVSDCSRWLKFQLISGASENVSTLKLLDTRFCRVRYCPICQWRRSMMWKAKAYKMIPKVIADYPKYRWLFMTLTVKNCQIENLRKTIEEMNKAFKRMTELKVWSIKGWIKSVEVTKGKDGSSAHPHLHVLAMVMPSYFSHGYI
jgi:plasmid rolling circle replication initiator protein Rep